MDQLRCLTETAKTHNMTTTKVTKIIVSDTEMKLHLLTYDVILPIISTLSVESIINLCKTSRKFAAICKDNQVWKFLLKRDFGVVYTQKDGAREEYIRCYFSPMVSCGDNFTGFITRKKELYMLGLNHYHQLGTGQKTYKDIWEPQFIFKCIQISCGTHFAGAATVEGELFMWGNNEAGQLGDDTVVRRHIPTLIKIEGNPKIVQVSCGADHTAAITKDGKLYTWGRIYSSRAPVYKTPTRVRYIRGKIIQVSCGTDFTAAVTEEGKLYTWGNNQFDKLGNNTKADKYMVPTLIKIKGNSLLKFIQVSCGDHHAGAVTTKGKLYMWGLNRDGQIGDGTNINRRKPKLIKIEGNPRFVQVSCGKNFTGAVTTTGKICMWGSNEKGKLGDNSYIGKNKPTFISIEGNRKVIQVSCGEFHTAAVTTDNQVYTWGWNHHSKLRDSTVNIVPKRKEIPRLVVS